MMNPNSTGLTRPVKTSRKTRICQTEVQYWRVSSANIRWATPQPPISPSRSAMMVRKNSMKAVAPTRGVTSFLVGSVPRARMASICSVTIIEPSSLAMPEELRPATISPVMSGPSSVTIPIDTSWPMSVIEPNRCNVLAAFSANRESRQNHDGQGADADQVRLLQHVAHVSRTAEEVREGLRREQGVLLNRQHISLGDFNGRNQFEFECHVWSGNFCSGNYSRERNHRVIERNHRVIW